MLETEFVLGPWHSSTSSDQVNFRVGELTDTTKFGSTEHSVRLEISVDDDATLAARLVADVLLRPSLLESSLQFLSFFKQRLLQTSIHDLLPVVDAIPLSILEVAEEEECFSINASKIHFLHEDETNFCKIYRVKIWGKFPIISLMLWANILGVGFNDR